jgi:hypothetical protein
MNEKPEPVAGDAPFFQRPDWLSFTLTTLLVLLVYLLTLAPEVTLSYSGIYSAGAMYAGIPTPPGLPVWTLYAWVFTKLPFSNIAWRLAVSSAVAGSLACGVIALMVSRGGALLIESMPALRGLAMREQHLLCVVCGCVAAMGFAFDGAFWQNAVIVETWALTLLLFALALCLLMRWIYKPTRLWCLYAAAFAYGLLLTDNQSLFVAAIGFEFLLLFAKPALGRDLLFGTALLLAVLLISHAREWFPTLEAIARSPAVWRVYLALCVISGLVSASVAFKQRRLLTEWRSALLIVCCLLAGLSVYFYPPIASMTNPPMNWSYPREFGGFVHLISRGQFESLRPTDSFIHFAAQMKIYFGRVLADFGLIYLIPAFIPWAVLRRMTQPGRSWLLGLLAVYFCLSFFFVAMLNPSADLQAQQLSKEYFAASHLILAIWSGYGLVLLGAWVAKNARPNQRI